MLALPCSLSWTLTRLKERGEGGGEAKRDEAGENSGATAPCAPRRQPCQTRAQRQRPPTGREEPRKSGARSGNRSCAFATRAPRLQSPPRRARWLREAHPHACCLPLSRAGRRPPPTRARRRRPLALVTGGVPSRRTGASSLTLVGDGLKEPACTSAEHLLLELAGPHA